jgi:hypothetical protein
MNEGAECVRRSFEVVTDSGVLAWGDADGIHYAGLVTAECNRNGSM